MQASLSRCGLAIVPRVKESKTARRGFGLTGWGLGLACVPVLMLMLTGCDPKPPPKEDLGTVLTGPPVLPGTEGPYPMPEKVAKAKKEWEREHPKDEQMGHEH